MAFFRDYADGWATKYFRLELARELHFRAKFIPALGLSVVFLLSSYFYKPEISFPLIYWVAAFTVIYVFMQFRFFGKAAKPCSETYKSWTWGFSATCWLAGFMWGLFPSIVFPSVSYFEQLALIMMLFAVLSVPAPALSRCLPLVMGYSILLISLVAIAFLSHHDGFDRHSVFVMVVFLGSLIYLYDQWGIAKEILNSAEDKRRLKTSGITIRRLKRDRYHDSVTDLFNKVGLITYLRSSGEDYSTFIIFALKVRDVDTLYSSHSKASIDDLIRDLTGRLQGCSFDKKTIAHLGLGEFLILVPGADSENLDSVGQDFFTLFEEPFNSPLGPMSFSVAIGCAFYPEHSTSRQGVIPYALTALKAAESQAGNHLELYTDDMAIQLNRRAFVRSQLASAIKHEEFVLHIQPKLNLQSNTVDSAEALVRWESPTMGMVSPAEFIPVAESTSDIVPLGRWVLKEAARILGGTRLPSKFSLAVNVSVKQLADPRFVPDIQEIARQLQGTGRTLELEITESIMITDEAIFRKTLGKVSELGVKIALDDFGTGYSSLSYLTSLTADRLKLDKSFIDPIPENQRQASFVSTVIAMAHSLGIPIVAEGVERPEQLKWLSENQCDTIQGYFLSRPLPLSQFSDWLESNVCPETNGFKAPLLVAAG
ncbi:EAL domain-containing protein [Marinobacter sp. AL4B]|nr:EAL domain-containing protein [Marinobacter sp. AL4B]